VAEQTIRYTFAVNDSAVKKSVEEQKSALKQLQAQTAVKSTQLAKEAAQQRALWADEKARLSGSVTDKMKAATAFRAAGIAADRSEAAVKRLALAGASVGDKGSKGAAILAGAIGGGLVKALDLAVGAFFKLGDAIGTALNQPALNALLSRRIQLEANVSAKVADSQVLKLSQEVSRQSGGTVDTAISGRAAQFLAPSAIKSLGADQGVKTAASIATNFSLIGNAAGVSADELADALKDLQSGYTAQQIAGRQVLAAAGLVDPLTKRLQKLGVTSTSQLKEGDRLKLLQSVGEDLASPEVKAAAKRSLKGFVGSITFALFDENQGVFSVKPIVSQLDESIKKATSSTDAGAAIGTALAQITNLAVNGSIAVVAGIPWGDVSKGIGAGLVAFVMNLDWSVYAVGALGLLAAAVVPAILPAVGTALAGLGAVIVGVVGGVPLLIGGAIVLGVIAIVKLFHDNWGSITKFVTSAMDATKNAVTSVVTGIKDAVVGFFQGVFGWIGNAFNAAKTAIESLWNRIPKPLQSVLMATPIGMAATAVSAVGSVVSKHEGTPNWREQLSAIPAAAGFMPLGGAIAREMAMKPANSGLVISNSSELILNKNQQIDLAQSLRGGGNVTANITIHQQPGEDSNTLADRVLQRLDQMVRQERNYRLA
jgi:hypothetical protein